MITEIRATTPAEVNIQLPLTQNVNGGRLDEVTMKPLTLSQMTEVLQERQEMDFFRKADLAAAACSLTSEQFGDLDAATAEALIDFYTNEMVPSQTFYEWDQALTETIAAKLSEDPEMPQTVVYTLHHPVSLDQKTLLKRVKIKPPPFRLLREFIEGWSSDDSVIQTSDLRESTQVPYLAEFYAQFIEMLAPGKGLLIDHAQNLSYIDARGIWAVLDFFLLAAKASMKTKSQKLKA